MANFPVKDLTGTRLDLNQFDVVVCAGGGNRCWWQAGLLKALGGHGLYPPPALVGTSAGAAIATAWVTHNIDHALESCKQLYGANARVFRWRPKKGEARFAQSLIYPEWIKSVLGTTGFESMRGLSSKVSIAVTRPSRWLGPSISIGLATLAYLADKVLGGKLHPTSLAQLGLSHEFFMVQESKSLTQAQHLLVAAAAAPPFIPSQQILNQRAFDGGYLDSMPIDPRFKLHKTLVLMTRHRPDLPKMFDFNHRTYWQPSTAIPVSTWDCTPSATVDQAFQLGQSDATNALAKQAIYLA